MKDDALIIEDPIDAPQEEIVDHGELEVSVRYARWMPAWYWEVRHKNVPTMTPVASGYANIQKDAHDAGKLLCTLLAGRAPAPSIIDRGASPRRRLKS